MCKLFKIKTYKWYKIKLKYLYIKYFLIYKFNNFKKIVTVD